MGFEVLFKIEEKNPKISGSLKELKVMNSVRKSMIQCQKVYKLTIWKYFEFNRSKQIAWLEL